MFKRYWWMLLVMAPVGMMAGFMFAAVVTYVMPKKYESFATIEIKPLTQQGVESAPTTQSIGMKTIVSYTEFDPIKGRNALSKVIDSLDLMNRWELDREAALQILKGIVQSEKIKGTDLIQIRVRHTNKEDARDIAAEVARAYKAYRDEVISESMEKGINDLRKAFREQKDKVEERRNAVTKLSRTGPLVYQESEADVAQGAQDYRDAKRDFETEMALLDKMRLQLMSGGLSPYEAEDAVVIHDDPVIADSPISPNVTFNLVAGSVGGLLLSPFLALPLMWWMNRRKR